MYWVCFKKSTNNFVRVFWLLMRTFSKRIELFLYSKPGLRKVESVHKAALPFQYKWSFIAYATVSTVAADV